MITQEHDKPLETDKNPQKPLLQFIIPHPTEIKIALAPHNQNWTLPHIAPDFEQSIWRYFNYGMELEKIWDWDVRVLYSPHFERAEDFENHRWVYVVENTAKKTDLPDGVCWFSHAEIANLTLDESHILPILEKYFIEIETGNFPKERPPWAFAGWVEKAESWIREQVNNPGYELTDAISLVRKWCLTVVLKVPTNSGDLYFKAVPPTFAREIAVTRFLHEKLPQCIPEVVAFNSDERWLLMRDFGGELLGNLTDAEQFPIWKAAVQQFAAVQIEMMQHTDTLFELGALDYRLDSLLTKFESLIGDSEIVKVDDRLSAETLEKLHQLLPEIKRRIHKLKSFNLPPTIVHADFHVWNITMKGSSATFFDWTDASVGSMFADMQMFFMRAKEVFKDTPENVEQLQETYLDALSDIAPKETLREAFSSGMLAGFVLQAANYHFLLQSIEKTERWTLELVPFILTDIVKFFESDS